MRSYVSLRSGYRYNQYRYSPVGLYLILVASFNTLLRIPTLRTEFNIFFIHFYQNVPHHSLCQQYSLGML